LSRLGPLARREFRLLFLGRAVSYLGNAIAPVALAFAVIDELNASKTDLGFVLAARSVPQVVFLLIGGIWADRLPRHHVMVASSLVSGASQGVIAVLLLTHHAQLWHLLALSAVNGAATAFFFPAVTGIVPQTVEPDLIQQANAVLRLTLNATSIGGAAAGGFLVATIGAGWAIAIDAVTFAFGALFIGAMSISAAERLAKTSFLADLREGWREFTGRTWLWVIVAQFSFVNAAQSGAFNVLGPVVALDELGGPTAWGLILGAEGIGLVAGGLLMLRLRPRRILLWATLAIFLMPITLLFLAAPAPVPAIMAAAFIAGVGVETFGILWDTAMQQQIPQEKLSRVSSYDALGSFVFIPVGLTAAGPVADAIGVKETLWLAAGCIVVVTLAALSVKDVRTLERRDNPPPAES
jgi:MFS family permease